MIIQTTEHFLCYVKAKILLALIPTGFFVVTSDHKGIVAIILWLLIIDTILGMAVAIKHKKFSSFRMVKAVHKFILYSMAMITAYLVSCLGIPLIDSFYLYVGSFIAVTEAFSNFEKLALLGFTLPQHILSKLNIDLDKAFNQNDEKAKNRFMKKEI